MATQRFSPCMEASENEMNTDLAEVPVRQRGYRAKQTFVYKMSFTTTNKFSPLHSQQLAAYGHAVEITFLNFNGPRQLAE